MTTKLARTEKTRGYTSIDDIREDIATFKDILYDTEKERNREIEQERDEVSLTTYDEAIEDLTNILINLAELRANFGLVQIATRIANN